MDLRRTPRRWQSTLRLSGLRFHVTPPTTPLSVHGTGSPVRSSRFPLSPGLQTGGGRDSPTHPHGPPPPGSTHTRRPRTSMMTNSSLGEGESQRPTQEESRRESKPLGVAGGGRGPGERGRRWSPRAVGRQRSRSSQELFSRGKNGFFSSHKVCIVAQRGALMAVRGLRGRDNLGSVPPAPRADRLPEGHKQSPGCQAPARSASGTGSQVTDKHMGPGRRGCTLPLPPGSVLGLRAQSAPGAPTGALRVDMRTR